TPEAQYARYPASRIPHPASRLEPLRSTKNPARHLRLELRRMARQFLSGRPAAFSLAGILRTLFPGGGNRFDLLSCAVGYNHSPLGRSDAGFVPLCLQTSARDHSRTHAARLQSRTRRLSPRCRTTRAE